MAAHAGGVVLEVAESGVDLGFLDTFEGVLASCPDDAVDVAAVEVLQAGGEPFLLVVQQHELQPAGKVVDVLAGMVKVGDLGRLRELGGGDARIQAAPSPMMVSWRTWSASRRIPSAFTRSPTAAAGSKVAMTLEESWSRTG